MDNCSYADSAGTATFARTGDLEVAGIAIRTDPKLKYLDNAEDIENPYVQNTLDLSELEATLTYNDGTTKDVPHSEFENEGITTNWGTGQILTKAEHNGQPVELTCNSCIAKTNNLDVTIGVEIITVSAPRDSIGLNERFKMSATISSPRKPDNAEVT